MKVQPIQINHIPALIWGPESDHVCIAVHGDMSHKEDTVIRLLAGEANRNGCQVLSFDLPEHGSRKQESTPCNAHTAIPDLTAVLSYAKIHWSVRSLFACSLGAYFSLMAYSDETFAKALLLSPVVDMTRLIESMMQWFSITPSQLENQGEIPTPIGKTLSWDYYTYTARNPIRSWPVKTSILYGENDNLTDLQTIEAFAATHHSHLELVPGGEHYFHTEEQLNRYKSWLQQNLKAN